MVIAYTKIRKEGKSMVVTIPKNSSKGFRNGQLVRIIIEEVPDANPIHDELNA